MKIITRMLVALCLIAFGGCETDTAPNSLKVSSNNLSIAPSGGIASFSIVTDAPLWTIDNPTPDWVLLSTVEGKGRESTVIITIPSKSLTERSCLLTIKAGTAPAATVTITQGASDYLYQINANTSNITAPIQVSTTSILINTDAPTWNLHSDADWIELSSTSGGQGSTLITATTPLNNAYKRFATLTLSAENALSVKISVFQDGKYFPNYNTSSIAPDETGMSSTAAELAAKIKVGWNIGNTLEAIGGETAWGNPLVTEDLIKTVKQNGFNAIRIPCAWNQYMEKSEFAQLKTSWLNRVKQVVQYCVDNDMYALLNIHWDGGWLENNCTPEKQEENNDKQRAFWQQIATHLRDFDEHLIFASANEPEVENATQMAVLQSYHQTFVNAVRATGGRNHYRVLAVQGPSTDIEKTNQLMLTMPTDVVPNRMMAEIHYYTPSQFCLLTKDASWGKMFYYWGNGYHSTTQPNFNATWGEEALVDQLMGLMKTQFVDKGIPVIMGEYMAIRRSALTGDNLTLHLASRCYYLKYVTQKAKANGILPFYWDAGNMGNNASALFNRKNNTVYDQTALDAIMDGAR